MNRPSQAHLLATAIAALAGFPMGGGAAEISTPYGMPHFSIPLPLVDRPGIRKHAGRRGWKNRARRARAECTRRGKVYRSGR